MDLEPEPLRRRYGLCRVGFGLAGVALLLLAADLALHILIHLIRLTSGRTPEWAWIVLTDGWAWLVGAPITWLSLIGTYLLWGRWSESSWQRRAGLLVVLNLCDLLYWGTTHAEKAGIGGMGLADDWFLSNLSRSFGWAELALTASLAADLGSHLGSKRAAEAGRATRSLVATAAMLWFFLFCNETAWDRGWPLVRAPLNDLGTYAMIIGIIGLQAMASLQVAGLCFAASRECGRLLGELGREGEDDPLLVSRSEHTDTF